MTLRYPRCVERVDLDSRFMPVDGTFPDFSLYEGLVWSLPLTLIQWPLISIRKRPKLSKTATGDRRASL